jgi:hypothetical protein
MSFQVFWGRGWSCVCERESFVLCGLVVEEEERAGGREGYTLWVESPRRGRGGTDGQTDREERGSSSEGARGEGRGGGTETERQRERETGGRGGRERESLCVCICVSLCVCVQACHLKPKKIADPGVAESWMIMEHVMHKIREGIYVLTNSFGILRYR